MLYGDIAHPSRTSHERKERSQLAALFPFMAEGNPLLRLLLDHLVPHDLDLGVAIAIDPDATLAAVVAHVDLDG